MASPLTVWSSTADGRVYGQDSTYLTARSTAYSYNTSNTFDIIGQAYSDPNYTCNEIFVSYDTSSVGAESTVTVAVEGLYGQYDGSTTDFVIEARIKNWGATLTDSDWIAGANLDDYTLVASYATSGGWSSSAYNNLSSESAFLTNIAQAGTTYLVHSSDRQLAANQPTGNEFVRTYLANDATGGGGTDRDPKLYVEWTSGAVVQTEAGAGTVTVTGTGAETLKKAAAGAGTVTLTGAGAGRLTAAEAGAGTVTVTAVATIGTGATQTEEGDGTVTVTATGTEDLTAAEAGSGTLSITGAATEQVTKSEAGPGTVTITGSGSGQLTAAEAGDATVTITATGTIGIQGTATEAGDATVTVTATGVEAVTCAETGAATLAVTGAGTIGVTHYVASEAGAGGFVLATTGEGFLSLVETGAGGFALDAEATIGIATLPTLTTKIINAILSDSAMSGGYILTVGSGEITERGVCWNTTGAPTIADPHTHD